MHSNFITDYNFFSVTKCLSTVDCKGESLEEKINNLLEERIRLTHAEKRLVSENYRNST